ncbi:hypothetical protein POX_d05258 [Penicillium oxalicum]|nr:hypothetical protein POX_d05258 [Penicillium oxalicum]KAI2789761.1 hypothetical protein POX_d05258 [Penicillium oxalicum]
MSMQRVRQRSTFPSSTFNVGIRFRECSLNLGEWKDHVLLSGFSRCQ